MDNKLTIEISHEVMKKRGYSVTASSGQNSKFFYVKSTEHGPLHAVVNIERCQIMLDFLELSLLCKLCTHEIDFFHKDFDRFENVLYLYVQKCKETDVFKLLNELQAPSVESEEKQSKKTLKERKGAFWEKIREKAKGKYSKEIAEEFYRYWTEHNENGRMMRFEKETVFNIEKRLITWFNNQEKFDKSRKNFVEKKIEKQNEAIKADTIKQINTKELF